MEILLISGPVESGKTYRLNQELRQDAKKGKKVLCFDSYVNTRISSREIFNIAQNFPVRNLSPTVSSQFERMTCDCDVIGFDEVQLYSKDAKSREVFRRALSSCLQRNNKDLKIVASGLNCDSHQMPFSTMSTMFSIATRIINLHSRASCDLCGGKENVNYSMRRDTAPKHNQIDVGASYVLCCSKCWDGKL